MKKRTYFLPVKNGEELIGYLECEIEVPKNEIPGTLNFRFEDGALVMDPAGKIVLIYRD